MSGPPAPVTCPRCARALPSGPLKVCVFCGTPLAVPKAGVAPRPSPRETLVGQVVGGRFRIEEIIGQGGMGKVYRARHLALDRPVCLKMLKPALLDDPTLVGRFEREAKAASRLNHPNGIQMLDFGRADDGALFIVMEYVQGKDLRTVLREEWPIDEDRLCNIMAQVLAALAEAHAHQVIHRDLKPENIMVEQRRDHPDFVKVLDFGIAKILDADLPGLTRSDVVCGTPQYMAPEQATGSSLDARCDLYAIGVILYQLATSHLPFDGQNSMEVLTRHVNEPPVPPRLREPRAPISAPMEALILRALEKDPALRPQTAAEFRELLLDVPRQRAALAATERELAPPPGARRTRRKLFPLLGGAGVALLAASAVLAAKLLHRGAGAAPALASVATAAKPVDPARAGGLLAKAAEWQAAGDTASARDLLLQAEELDPENAEVHWRLGNLFLNSQPERARKEYEEARRLNAEKYGATVESILKNL